MKKRSRSRTFTMTRNEAAAYLRISRSTLANWEDDPTKPQPIDKAKGIHRHYRRSDIENKRRESRAVEQERKQQHVPVRVRKVSTPTTAPTAKHRRDKIYPTKQECMADVYNAICKHGPACTRVNFLAMAKTGRSFETAISKSWEETVEACLRKYPKLRTLGEIRTAGVDVQARRVVVSVAKKKIIRAYDPRRTGKQGSEAIFSDPGPCSRAEAMERREDFRRCLKDAVEAAISSAFTKEVLLATMKSACKEAFREV